MSLAAPTSEACSAATPARVFNQSRLFMSELYRRWCIQSRITRTQSFAPVGAWRKELSLIALRGWLFALRDSGARIVPRVAHSMAKLAGSYPSRPAAWDIDKREAIAASGLGMVEIFRRILGQH